MKKRVEVRATINLPGLGVGEHVLVDPEQPYMKMSLEAGHLVATGREALIPDVPSRVAVRPPAAAPVPPVAPKKRAPRKKKPVGDTGLPAL